MLLRQPFDPLTIVLTSGDRYLVEDPFNVPLMDSRIFYALPGKHPRPAWVFIRFNQIAALEAHERAA